MAALGVAELVAGLVRRWKSPVEAVAEFVIDESPSSVTKFGIRVFGTNDKLALVIGVLVVLTIIGLVVGVLSRRRPVVGYVAFAGFGLVGAYAALQQPSAGLIDIVPALAAAATGAGVLTLLRRRLAALDPAAEVDHAEPAETVAAPALQTNRKNEPPSRRAFLVMSGVIVAGAGIAAVGGRRLKARFSAVESRQNLVLARPERALPAVPAQAAVDVEGMTPFITSNRDFYRIDTALTVPQVPVESWELKVTGMVDDELTLTFDDLVEVGLVEADVTLTCVSNRVGGDLVGNARWLGVPVERLLEMAGVDDRADQLVGRSVDDYTCGFPIEAATDGRTCLVAVGMNGEPLPLEHGFPARLVTAGLYGYISATKWLTEIELTTFDAFDSYWVPRGYADRAPIKTQCRIDVPRTGELIPAGAGSIAGVAWAQTTGISKVEVRVDDGPWREAELADELSNETWRQWRIDWDPEPGPRRILCRATDADGVLQPEERTEPLPDGASGWQSKLVVDQDA